MHMHPGIAPTPTACPRPLHSLTTTWGAAALLPLPVLLATTPATNADVACLYLGVATAWLATEIFAAGGLPQSPREWRTKILAIIIAVLTNAALFIALGICVGVKSHFPFPLMASLSTVPAMGLIPFLMNRIRHPMTTILLAALIALSAKLAACVVARITYGADYIARGYVAGDWRSAKLMISTFWIFTTTLSLGLLIADFYRVKRADTPQPPV
jgi:hypothetical protein